MSIGGRLLWSSPPREYDAGCICMGQSSAVMANAQADALVSKVGLGGGALKSPLDMREVRGPERLHAMPEISTGRHRPTH